MNKVFQYVSLLAMLVAIHGKLNSTKMVGKNLAKRRTIPRFYDIAIDLDATRDDMIWTGNVSITIEVLVRTKKFILYAHENLVIDERFTRVVGPSGSGLPPISHNRESSLDLLTLQFNQWLPKGEYRLQLNFRGKGIELFPRAYRYEAHGRIFATENFFELTSARRIFPCWDEFNDTTPFRITITIPPHIVTSVGFALMGGRWEAPHRIILSVFGEMPIVSSLLIDFGAVLRHCPVELSHPDTTNLDRLKTPEDTNNFTLNVVQKLKSYTEISPDLSEKELANMHIQYGSAIDDSYLIRHASRQIESISDVTVLKLLITSGLAYKWFGIRVMPLEENEIWLIEAFPFYFQYYIMDLIDKNWHGAELFVVLNNQEKAFSKDNSASVTVKSNLSTSGEENSMYRTFINYKGSAIVHMFRNVLGDDAFRAGIRTFLAKYSFKSVVTDDLAGEFQIAYDETHKRDKSLNVSKAMNSWLTQSGYPMLNVKRNYDTGETVVKQQSTLSSKASNKWWIPLTYATKSNPDFSSTLPSSWISDKNYSKEIDGINKDDWIIFNVQASGYYRVNYDDKNWERLIKYLNTDKYTNIHVLNRAQLISDMSYLAHHEESKYNCTFFNLINYLQREVEYLPWRAALSAIKTVLAKLPDDSDKLMRIEDRVVKLMNRLFKKVGIVPRATDDHFTRLSRTEIISWACMAGHAGCTEYAIAKIRQFAKNPQSYSLHADVENWILCAGFRELDDEEVESIVILAYQRGNYVFLPHVGCTDDHVFHEALFQVIIDSGVTSYQKHLQTVITSLKESSKENSRYASDWMKESGDLLYETLESKKLRDFVRRWLAWWCKNEMEQTELIIAVCATVAANLPKYWKD